MIDAEKFNALRDEYLALKAIVDEGEQERSEIEARITDAGVKLRAKRQEIMVLIFDSNGVLQVIS